MALWGYTSGQDAKSNSSNASFLPAVRVGVGSSKRVMAEAVRKSEVQIPVLGQAKEGRLMPYRVPNWSSYQGYIKRGPPWVKLHVGLLRKREWLKLSLQGKALLPAIWIIASENGVDGSFTDDHEALAHLAGVDQSSLCIGIKALMSFGFIESDGVVATCAIELSGETEERQRRVEGERETAGVSATVLSHATATALSTDFEIDTERFELDTEESNLLRILVSLQSSGADVQAVCDDIGRESKRAPFNAHRALVGGKSGIPMNSDGLTVRRRLIDALEARQRAQDQPIISDSNRLTMEASARVLARIKAGTVKEIEG